jgi:hypothetical protein
VITLDTASLVAAYESRIELCKFNSGFAQPHNKKRRNRASFLPIADYPHPQRTVANPRGEDVAELTVLGSVDVLPHVIQMAIVLPLLVLMPSTARPPFLPRLCRGKLLVESQVLQIRMSRITNHSFLR